MSRLALIAVSIFLSFPAFADERIISTDESELILSTARPDLAAITQYPLLSCCMAALATVVKPRHRIGGTAWPRPTALWSPTRMHSGAAGTPAGIVADAAYSENVDDIKFITAVIHAVTQAENIDPRHIYLAGISNGAAMSTYACAGPVAVAAIGSVSGTMPGGCQAAKPVSVIRIRGTQGSEYSFCRRSRHQGRHRN